MSEVIKQMLTEFSQRVVERAQRNLGATYTIKIGGKSRRRRPDSSGMLRRSLTYKMIGVGPRYMIQYGARPPANVYADVVEKGRRPNSRQPPMDAILKWMSIKPIRLRNESGGFIKTTESKKRAAAFLIARKIGKLGIPGIHYMDNAFKEELTAAGPEFIESLQRELEIALAL